MPRYQRVDGPAEMYFDVLLLLENRELYVFFVCEHHVRQVIDVETARVWEAHDKGVVAKPVQWYVIPPDHPRRCEPGDCQVCRQLEDTTDVGGRHVVPQVRTPVKVYPADP